jgi:hypothetical protein
MKYLCLVYREETKVATLSESEYDALMREVIDYREELRKSGYSIASDTLQPVQMATTIRVQNDTIFIIDGPVIETKEQLGEFYLINARDLNEAIRVASKIPPARMGCIEVRPIKEINEGRYAKHLTH